MDHVIHLTKSKEIPSLKLSFSTELRIPRNSRNRAGHSVINGLGFKAVTQANDLTLNSSFFRKTS